MVRCHGLRPQNDRRPPDLDFGNRSAPGDKRFKYGETAKLIGLSAEVVQTDFSGLATDPRKAILLVGEENSHFCYVKEIGEDRIDLVDNGKLRTFDKDALNNYWQNGYAILIDRTENWEAASLAEKRRKNLSLIFVCCGFALLGTGIFVLRKRRPSTVENSS
ncbi:MAG: cysteine peptidase family C39 domain-containing protein [Planctomycetota bacterium]